MAELLRAAQMRALEAAAIESGAVTGLELMERAGAGVVEAVLEEWPELGVGAQRAVVLCGPGNNGGDGFVVARMLKQARWAVEVFFYGDADRLPPDSKVNYERWSEKNEIVHLGYPYATDAAQIAFEHAASHSVDDLPNDPNRAKPPFLVVDALFGIGLTRPISGLDAVMRHMDYLRLSRDLNESRRVAVDVPSGFDTDTGQLVWPKRSDASVVPCIASDLVVTFHARKPVHNVIENESTKIVVKDIGLGPFSDLKKSPPEA